MIASMARWMGFIGWFIMVASSIGVFGIVVGFLFLMLVSGNGGAMLEKMGSFGEFLQANQSTLGFLFAALLLVNALQIAAGYYLYWASRDFDNVARTNEADQDFLASGLTRLRDCAKISTTVAIFQLLVNVLAGLALTDIQKLTG